jgi:mevalonate pyrophosphate decarboxylase
MIVKSDGSAVIKGVHECKQNGSIKFATIGEIYDAGPEIKQMIQDSSIEDVSKSVQSIAKRVHGEILEKHKGRPFYLLYLYY